MLAMRVVPAMAPLQLRGVTALPQISRRAYSSLRSSTTTRTITPLPRRNLAVSFLALQLSFRRSYADAPKVELSPEPRKRRGFFRSTLVWTWRATYISLLGVLGFLGYSVYDSNHPNEQFEPDPNKKTLVILGW